MWLGTTELVEEGQFLLFCLIPFPWWEVGLEQKNGWKKTLPQISGMRIAEQMSSLKSLASLCISPVSDSLLPVCCLCSIDFILPLFFSQGKMPPPNEDSVKHNCFHEGKTVKNDESTFPALLAS